MSFNVVYLLKCINGYRVLNLPSKFRASFSTKLSTTPEAKTFLKLLIPPKLEGLVPLVLVFLLLKLFNYTNLFDSFIHSIGYSSLKDRVTEEFVFGILTVAPRTFYPFTSWAHQWFLSFMVSCLLLLKLFLWHWQSVLVLHFLMFA